MSAMLASSSNNPPTSNATSGVRRLHSERVEPDHTDRAEAEAFIAAVYRERYGAELRSFLPHLIVFRDETRAICAAVGLRYAREGRLFVERYLDADAETEIARAQRTPVPRERVVEVGNFASRTPGDAREVIVRLTSLLHAEGVRWVLFAATRQWRNTFDRLHLQTVPLAPADPARVQDSDNQWGRYYDAKPMVLTGDLASGYAYLQRRADAAGPAERGWWLSSPLSAPCAAAS